MTGLIHISLEIIRNIKYRTISLSVIAALVFWVLDAAIDMLMFYDESFIEVLIGNKQEIAFRLLTSAFLLGFGILAGRAFSKQKDIQNRLAIEMDQRKGTEDALRMSEGKFRSLVESTDDFVYMVDKDLNYQYMNRNYSTTMGFSGDEYIGRAYCDIHLSTEIEWFKRIVAEVFLNGKSVQHEYKSKRNNHYYLQTLSPVEGAGGDIVSVTVISKDITNLKLVEEQLQTLSTTDELTGLLNRRGFFEVSKRFVAMASRKNTQVCLLYIDLDGLKVINDSFGHNAGDLAIIEMANVLKNCFRDSDIIARMGGDEFVVFPIETSCATMEIITTRLHNGLKTYNETSDTDFKLSASCGIALYDPDKPDSLDELLMQADKDMYEQKSNKHR